LIPAHVRFHPIQGSSVYPEAAGHIHDGVTSVQSLDRLAALMRGELERSAEPDAAHFGSLPALPVRALMRVRSNSARPPKTVNISTPWGVVVSHHASLSERKPAPACFTASKTFNRSRVERARRSSRVVEREKIWRELRAAATILSSKKIVRARLRN
jgi:hypothetical protein